MTTTDEWIAALRAEMDVHGAMIRCRTGDRLNTEGQPEVFTWWTLSDGYECETVWALPAGADSEAAQRLATAVAGIIRRSLIDAGVTVSDGPMANGRQS